MRIAVLDGYTLNPGDNPWNEIEDLGEVTVHDRTDAQQIVERASGADVVLTNKTPLSAETLARLPDLKFIAVLATGYNMVDVSAARQRGIPVSNVPAYSSDSVAQLTFALLLELCHHVGLHDELVREGEWQRRGEFCFWDRPLIELAGKTMGIIGFGRIGRRVGELAHAFGMNVLAYDVCAESEPAYMPFAWKTVSDIFAAADVVSLHCPQTDDNVGMVNRDLLELARPELMLINTARGGLVNEADLAAALNAGRIAAAAVDVQTAEPPAQDSPLAGAENCIRTPHIAWATLEARRRLMGDHGGEHRSLHRGKPDPRRQLRSVTQGEITMRLVDWMLRRETGIVSAASSEGPVLPGLSAQPRMIARALRPRAVPLEPCPTASYGPCATRYDLPDGGEH